MVTSIASFILKFVSLGFVIAAGALWESGDVDMRPKNRDEQTLIGGAVWSQTQIPIGLLISMVVDEGLYSFVHTYFLFTGFMILGVTGVMLITVEGKKLKKSCSVITISSGRPEFVEVFDKVYFIIGILTLLAAILTFIDFVLNII